MSLLPKLALAESLPSPGWLPRQGCSSPELLQPLMGFLPWLCPCRHHHLGDFLRPDWPTRGPLSLADSHCSPDGVPLASVAPRSKPRENYSPAVVPAPSPLPSAFSGGLSQAFVLPFPAGQLSPCSLSQESLMVAHLALTLLRATTCLHAVQDLFLKHLFTICHFSNL